MSDEWRTDEPEVGQIAHVLYGSKIYLYECKKHESGAFKIWWNGDDWIRVNEADLNQWLPIVDEADFNQWQPITTPEERRLRDLLRRALPYVVSEDMEIAEHGGTSTAHAQFADEIRRAIGSLPGGE